jgi:ribosomal protein S18 acetylase RimI-like enzyme
MKKINYQKLNLSQLSEIRPLWEALNQIHGEDSVCFKDHYARFTFEKRSARRETMSEEDVLILVAENAGQQLIGYCVSTIDKQKLGEIDSLYVSPEFRGCGVGRTFTVRSLEWLQSNRCKPIRLAVSYGHESVLPFYQTIGFYPQLTILEYKDKE